MNEYYRIIKIEPSSMYEGEVFTFNVFFKNDQGKSFVIEQTASELIKLSPKVNYKYDSIVITGSSNKAHFEKNLFNSDNSNKLVLIPNKITFNILQIDFTDKSVIVNAESCNVTLEDYVLNRDEKFDPDKVDSLIIKVSLQGLSLVSIE